MKRALRVQGVEPAKGLRTTADSQDGMPPLWPARLFRVDRNFVEEAMGQDDAALAPTPFLKRVGPVFRVAFMVYFVGATVYAGYGAITRTGLPGELITLQLNTLGWASMKTSFLLASIVCLLPALAILQIIDRNRSFAASCPKHAAPRSTAGSDGGPDSTGFSGTWLKDTPTDPPILIITGNASGDYSVRELIRSGFFKIERGSRGKLENTLLRLRSASGIVSREFRSIDRDTLIQVDESALAEASLGITWKRVDADYPSTQNREVDAAAIEM